MITTKCPTVGQTAFLTVTGLSVAALGSVAATVAATTTVAKIGFTTLSVVLGAVGIASMTAYGEPTSTTSNKYFENCKYHSGKIIPATFQLYNGKKIINNYKARRSLSSLILIKVRKTILFTELALLEDIFPAKALLALVDYQEFH